MRLIDADDFKKFIQALCKAGSPYESFIELLDKQTTAYDIGKVVEQLKTDSSIKLYGSGNSNNYLISVERAINIVKAGGIINEQS